MRQGARSYLCLFPKCSERTVVCHSQLVEPSPWSLVRRFLLPPPRITQKWRLHKTSAVATAHKKRKKIIKKWATEPQDSETQTLSQARAQSQEQNVEAEAAADPVANPKTDSMRTNFRCTSTKGVSSEGKGATVAAVENKMRTVRNS